MSSTFVKHSITTELANRIIAAATAKAVELDLRVSIAVVDESGLLKSFTRMDGANVAGMQAAQDKAYTAVMYQWDTALWATYLESSHVLRVGAANYDRLNVYAGGCVIRVAGELVGAIGVSGAGIEEDAAIAGVWSDVVG